MDHKIVRYREIGELGISVLMVPSYAVNALEHFMRFIKEDGTYVYLEPPNGEDSSDNAFLPYKHVSQYGLNANANRNDCGIACIVSVIHQHGYPDYTVNQVSSVYQRPNKPMFIREVMQALSGYQLASRHDVGVTPEDIEYHIRENLAPVIGLVHYPEMPSQPVKFNGSHYVLFYGVDGHRNLYYHDPLDKDGFDGTRSITQGQLRSALQSVTKDGNQPNQAIFLNL